MIKPLIISAALIGATIPAFAGEDCLGLSIGPGCIGIDADDGRRYRRSERVPDNGRVYVAPRGGRYYYNDDSYYYERD